MLYSTFDLQEHCSVHTCEAYMHMKVNMLKMQASSPQCAPNSNPMLRLSDSGATSDPLHTFKHAQAMTGCKLNARAW